MADNPRDKKKMQTVRDWINRLPEKSRALEFEQRRKLWEALRAYLHSNGGSVTGLPGTKHLRAEVPRGSSLPAKLMEFGYDVRHSGTGTSLTSGTTDARCLPVDVIDISLSGNDSWQFNPLGGRCGLLTDLSRVLSNGQ